jgi:hypothetical protein
MTTVTVATLQPVALNGSVYPAGAQVVIDMHDLERLENAGLVARPESAWPDRERLPKSHVGQPVHDVLIATPVLRLEPATVQALMMLEWDGPLSMLLQRDNPTASGRHNHLHQYQRIRQHFLAGPYDALLVVESDIIPPADALRKLAAVQADAAYGVYRFRESDVINIFERYPGAETPRNVGQSLSIKPALKKRAVQRQVWPCSGGGLGIVLLRRPVLERIDFRLEETAHCDTYFTRDVLRAGFGQVAEMSVICGHVHEDGRVLWPSL